MLVTVRILHVSSMCSRSISGSLLLWRISGGTSSFLGKGQQPVLVEPRCGLVSKRARSGALLPEARSFDDKFDAVGAPSAERRRAAQTRRTSAESAPESVETAAEEKALETPKGDLSAIATACARTAVRARRSDRRCRSPTSPRLPCCLSRTSVPTPSRSISPMASWRISRWRCRSFAGCL